MRFAMTKTRDERGNALQPRHCARQLRAVAHPERLRIIQCLMAGPRHVSEIAGALGTEIANASHHLGVLRDAGLIDDEKQGRFVLYRLDPRAFRAAHGGTPAHLDFGCCRLEIPDQPAGT